jgi:hypothetical protein
LEDATRCLNCVILFGGLRSNSGQRESRGTARDHLDAVRRGLAAAAHQTAEPGRRVPGWSNRI